MIDNINLLRSFNILIALTNPVLIIIECNGIRYISRSVEGPYVCGYCLLCEICSKIESNLCYEIYRKIDIPVNGIYFVKASLFRVLLYTYGDTGHNKN